MAKKAKKVILSARDKRRQRLRKQIRGAEGKPRLSVFKSCKHTYAQLIEDDQGTTLACASTLDAKVKELIADVDMKKSHNDVRSIKSCAGAKAVGLLLAEKAKAKGIQQVIFDRNGYIYHGRVRAVADGARKGGLSF